MELKYSRKEGLGDEGRKIRGKQIFFPFKWRKEHRNVETSPQRIRKWRKWDEALIYGKLSQNM